MSQGKKILFVATINTFFLSFLTPYLRWLKEQGHEVHVAAGGVEQIPYVSRQFNISIQRSPFSLENFKAYWELKRIIRDNNYDLIHCHTPMGGVLARLAARPFRKNYGLKVLYTAHGFHFCKGAPLLNRILYYPVEKILAPYTDGLITINREDFENSKKFGLKCREIYRISGIGVNAEKFVPVSEEEKNKIRVENGYPAKAFILLYAAEFNSRKNHKFIVETLPKLVKQIPELKVIFAGRGNLSNEIIILANKNGLSETIGFEGYRNDMEKRIVMADAVISPSRMEGLPMNVAEAMFCGLPVVVTRIRGHVDLVTHGINGLLFNDGDHETFIQHIRDLYRSPEFRKKLGDKARETVQPFGIGQVLPQMTDIYRNYLS